MARKTHARRPGSKDSSWATAASQSRIEHITTRRVPNTTTYPSLRLNQTRVDPRTSVEAKNPLDGQSSGFPVAVAAEVV